MAKEAKLCLYSAYENIELAEKVLFELVRHQGDEESLYWIAMALREALANAIKHGNKCNPEKRVFVHFRWEEERRIWITVQDEGEGFDPDQLADPRSPENLLKESGRGVFYIRHFMEGVRFRRSPIGGTIVKMYKDLPGRNT
ncbi:MAG: ATP-binding protein [Thermoanaerobaculaceae bacterium]